MSYFKITVQQTCVVCGSHETEILADDESTAVKTINSIFADLREGVCQGCWARYREDRKTLCREHWLKFFGDKLPIPEHYK